MPVGPGPAAEEPGETPPPRLRRVARDLLGYLRWRWHLLLPVFGTGIIVGALFAAWFIGRGDVALSPAGLPDLNPDITITISEGLLSALIRQSVALGESPVPLENVRVDTRDGLIVILGDVVVLGRNVGSSIELEPGVANGRVRVRLRRARLGPLPIPAGIERLAEGPINARIEAALGGLPATVTSVQSTDRGLTITARVRTNELNLSR